MRRNETKRNETNRRDVGSFSGDCPSGDGNGRAAVGLAESDDAFIGRERHQRSVSRHVRLPASVDEEGAETTDPNGVLTVTFPPALRLPGRC